MIVSISRVILKNVNSAPVRVRRMIIEGIVAVITNNGILRSKYIRAKFET
tara:strand:- start:98 stop:247 length:150 start_codon:yes stop_codon:yes gene_type:complete